MSGKTGHTSPSLSEVGLFSQAERQPVGISWDAVMCECRKKACHPATQGKGRVEEVHLDGNGSISHATGRRSKEKGKADGLWRTQPSQRYKSASHPIMKG